MKMKDCIYHPGKMYWLENEEREFKNFIKYTNSFIATFHDREYPNNLIYRKFTNGQSFVNWANKLNNDYRKGHEQERIGLHRCYHPNVDEEYIKNIEKEYSPELILTKWGEKESNNIKEITINDLYGVDMHEIKYLFAKKINELIKEINK